MEKARMVRSRFWRDNYIQTKLNPLDRYLFLYFITNDKTNICGIYEAPLKVISVETGIDPAELERSMLPKLKEKIIYYEGWVIIKNFQKHQNLDSPSIIRAIQKEISNIPEKVLKYAIKTGYEHRVDTLSTPWGQSESESESESKDMSAYADPSFNSFWTSYPKKELKRRAYAIWKRKKLESKLDKILVFIEKAKQTSRWKRGFIKQPPAFLNGECWEDDLESYQDKQITNNQNEWWKK